MKNIFGGDKGTTANNNNKSSSSSSSNKSNNNFKPGSQESMSKLKCSVRFFKWSKAISHTYLRTLEKNQPRRKMNHSYLANTVAVDVLHGESLDVMLLKKRSLPVINITQTDEDNLRKNGER